VDHQVKPGDDGNGKPSLQRHGDGGTTARSFLVATAGSAGFTCKSDQRA
jgi:hypothetical protein